MIAQISIGEGFGGLVNYANDIAKKDTVIIASYGVNLSSNATITASFKASSAADVKPITKPFSSTKGPPLFPGWIGTLI